MIDTHRLPRTVTPSRQAQTLGQSGGEGGTHTLPREGSLVTLSPGVSPQAGSHAMSCLDAACHLPKRGQVIRLRLERSWGMRVDALRLGSLLGVGF